MVDMYKDWVIVDSNDIKKRETIMCILTAAGFEVRNGIGRSPGFPYICKEGNVIYNCNYKDDFWESHRNMQKITYEEAVEALKSIIENEHNREEVAGK